MNTTTCIEVLRNKSAFLLLYHLTPVNDEKQQLWQEQSELWRLLFVLFTAIYGVLYLKLGILCIVMIIKKNSARLPTKTFVVIYSCLAILGLSRALVLALDPFGIVGWIMKPFPYWNIISRMIGALGFPSVAAAYTLVFLTLYKAAEIGASRLWLQNLRVVVSIALVHYVIAIVAEAIAHVAPYPAIISVLICEGSFVLWGILIGIFYLFAGGRLRRKLKGQCTRAVARSLSRLERRPPVGLMEEELRRHYKRIAQTVRKIALISYGTAILGILYAAVSAASLVATSLFVFEDCMGLNQPGNPVVWLSITVVSRNLEISLAYVMLYSVTDVRGVLGSIKQSLLCCCCTSNTDQMTSSCSTKKHLPTVKHNEQPIVTCSQSLQPSSKPRTSSQESVQTTCSTLTAPITPCTSTFEHINKSTEDLV